MNKEKKKNHIYNTFSYLSIKSKKFKPEKLIFLN